MIGGVTRHKLPHLSGVPHLHVNRPFNIHRTCQTILFFSNVTATLACIYLKLLLVLYHHFREGRGQGHTGLVLFIIIVFFSSALKWNSSSSHIEKLITKKLDEISGHCVLTPRMPNDLRNLWPDARTPSPL